MRAAIILMLATATAHAGDSHEVSISEQLRALRTSSANAMTEDSLFGGALAYEHNFGTPLVPAIQLWGVGAFGWGAAEGTMFQTLSTELDTLSFTIGARARYALRPRIVASARLDIGTTRAAVAIRDDANHTASDHGWGATTQAALGLDLYAIRSAAFTMGVRVELGYVATSSIPLVATPESPSEGTLQLEMTAASLGSLNLSGKLFAASLVGQF